MKKQQIIDSIIDLYNSINKLTKLDDTLRELKYDLERYLNTVEDDKTGKFAIKIKLPLLREDFLVDKADRIRIFESEDDARLYIINCIESTRNIVISCRVVELKVKDLI